MTDRLPLPRVVPGDAEVLEERARTLAAGEAAAERAAGLLRLVAFQLGGRPCAVDSAVVSRAVVLASPMAIPLADGTERPVAFVEERPLPVADLAGAAADGARAATSLAGAPALVLETADGAVAVAVEGPLELAEDRLAAATAAGAAGTIPRVAGRLAGGAALVDGVWLSAWAAKAVRP